MTDELPELEPLDTPATAPAMEAAAAGQPAQKPSSPGLPAPAYSVGADKEYYRFLFAGVVITVGSLMPYGPEWDMAGYKTLSGAIALIVGIGLIWTWWGAISINRFRGANLKWVAYAFLPLMITLFGFMRAFESPAYVAFKSMGKQLPADWMEFIKAFFALKDAPSQEMADNFVRATGSGKFVVFLGAVWAEISMLFALFGGAKTARAQKAAKVAAAASKRPERTKR
ncbi:MAG: hypothetical protein U1F36_09415 [Planctomycetota bacterium]